MNDILTDMSASQLGEDEGMDTNGRTVVTLVGRRRDWRLLREAERAETMAGRVVLTVGCLGPEGGTSREDDHDEEMARQCIALHFDKIRMADEIVHATADGTVGEHTQADLDLAVSLGKPIRLYLTNDWPE